MIGRLNITETYALSRSLVRKYFFRLKANTVSITAGVLAIEFPHSEIYEKKFICEEKTLQLTIILPEFFPDEFPKIFIDENLFGQIYPSPHINKDRSVCTFDNFTRPNPEFPVEVVAKTIEKAEAIIKDILEKNDALKSEYLDEITHYWSINTQGLVYSLIEPRSESCKVYFGLRSNKSILVVALTIKEIVNWYKNRGIDGKEINIIPGVYISDLDYGVPPFPVNNKGWSKLFENKGFAFLKQLNSLLEEYEWPIIALFSRKTTNLFTWGVIQFTRKPVFEVNARKKHKIRNYVRGFRSGKAPFIQELRAFPKNEVQRFIVEPVYSSRLQDRGGEGEQFNYNHSILLAGCGSIGSNLAELLVQSGLGHLSFLDPERLMFENIARHVCGANYVGKNKAEALKENLGQRFPYAFFQTYEESIYRILQKNPEWINRHDLVVCAIGEYNAEMRLNRALVNHEIEKPILIVWVEPYLIAGHAVYIRPNSEGCFECLFSDNSIDKNFIHKVLLPNSHFTKREAGCGSLYIPYGIAKIKAFISQLTLFIADLLVEPPDNSVVWSWLGNLDEARDREFRLSSEWRNASNYRMYKQELNARRGCVCRNAN